MKRSILILYLFICYYPPIFAQQYLDIEIITLNNTRVKTKIIPLTKKKYHDHLYIEIYDTVSIGKKIYPQNIAGYCTKDTEYKSFSIYDTIQKRNWNVFAQIIEKGACELLYMKIALYDYHSFYAFKLNNEKYYHLFTNDMILEMSPSHYSYYIFHDEDVFKNYFAFYFKKCPIVSRKIKHELYNISLFPEMVKDYNDCMVLPTIPTH